MNSSIFPVQLDTSEQYIIKALLQDAYTALIDAIDSADTDGLFESDFSLSDEVFDAAGVVTALVDVEDSYDENTGTGSHFATLQTFDIEITSFEPNLSTDEAEENVNFLSGIKIRDIERELKALVLYRYKHR